MKYFVGLFILFFLACNKSNLVSDCNTNAKVKPLELQMVYKEERIIAYRGILDSLIIPKELNKLHNNRKVISRNQKGIPMLQSGTIVIKTCIDKTGSVVFATPIDEECTIKDKGILKQATKAAAGYVYEADINSNELICGELTITLDIKRFR